MKPWVTWSWRALRTVLALVLIAWIFRRIGLGSDAFESSAWSPRWRLWMATAEAVYFGVYLTGIARWRLLMRAQSIDLPFRRLFTLFFIGHFYNAFMLGATGGDLFKAWAVARESRHQKTEAAALVFLDRLVGLATLVLLVLLVLAIRAPLLRAPGAIRTAFLLLAGFAVGTAVLLAVLFRRNRLQSRTWRRLTASRRLPQPVLAQAARIYTAAFRIREQPRLLLRLVLLSLAVHLLSLGANFLFAVAIGAPLSPLQALTLFPLVGALGAIPLTPGGLGVREGGAVLIFGTVGIPPLTAALLGLLPYLGITLWSLFGGLLVLAEPWRRTPPSAAVPDREPTG